MLVLISGCLAGTYTRSRTLSWSRLWPSHPRADRRACSPTLAITVAAVAWSILHSFTAFQTLNTILLMVFRDFLLSSAVVATLLWCVPADVYASGLSIAFKTDTDLPCTALCSVRFLTNSLLLSPPTHSSSSDAKVEWNFAFDVAVNAFFCFFLWIYLGQFVLYGLVTRE